MAAVGGQHVPGTAFHWEHGYHPLDEATAVKNKHKWRGTPGSGKKETGVHRVTDASGNHSHVAGPDSAKTAAKYGAKPHWSAEHHVDTHEKELDAAPKQVRQVWDAARAHGWNVQLATGENSGGKKTHTVRVVSPDGKIKHNLDWADGKRATSGNATSTRKALDDINSYKPTSPSKQMDDAIRSRARRHDVTSSPAAPQSKEDRALAEARAREAKDAEERRRQVANYEAAQAQQREARAAYDAKQAQEKKDTEDKARRVAAEQKLRAERAKHLISQAAQAYKAGDYHKALRLLDEAIAADPSRASYLRTRKDMVREKQQQAQGASH